MGLELELELGWGLELELELGLGPVWLKGPALVRRSEEGDKEEEGDSKEAIKGADGVAPGPVGSDDRVAELEKEETPYAEGVARSRADIEYGRGRASKDARS